MTKKEETKPAQKDPQYAKKLEAKARQMFGKQYRFLPADQKRAVQAETPFEPKKETDQTGNKAEASETEAPLSTTEPLKASPETEVVTKANVEEETEDEAEGAVLKKPEIITQHKCEDRHVTNGLPHAPPRRCQHCGKPVKLTGRFVNDIFEPVKEK